MRATRILALRGGLSSTGRLGPPKLLLPQPSGFETLGDALQGWWSHITDQPSREAYEEAVEKNVIKDTVLQNANAGIVLTYSLFHRLQNPLFRQYNFDSAGFVDFCETVGPALENFHDALARLRSEMLDPKEGGDQKQETTSLKEQQEEQPAGAAASPDVVLGTDQTLQTLLGANEWRQQAEQDKDSLAGNIAGMTTANMMDALYYTTKLDILTRATLDGSNSPGKYVPGSVKVTDVALVNARAMMMDTKTGKEKFSEFLASEEDGPNAAAAAAAADNIDVAAQIDVLFEVTHEYTRGGSMSASDIVASMASTPATNEAKVSNEESTGTENNSADDDTTSTAAAAKKDDSTKEESETSSLDENSGGGDNNNNSSDDENADDSVETMLYTNLAVAVFEGWLYRSADGDKDSLQWRISMLRDAFEFPHHQPTITSSRTSSRDQS